MGASKRGFAVVRYRDEAAGVITRDAKGKVWGKVTLAPQTEWVAHAPTPDKLAQLHHAVHTDIAVQ